MKKERDLEDFSKNDKDLLYLEGKIDKNEMTEEIISELLEFYRVYYQ